MSNDCSNELKITGNKTTIEAMLEKIKSEESEFDFNKVVPVPSREDPLPKWGTRWLPDDGVSIDITDDETYITFSTGWSPSLPVTKRLAELFPVLRFEHRYEEPGMDFSGFAIFDGGKLVDKAEGVMEEYRLKYSPYYEEDDEETDDNDDGNSSGEVGDSVDNEGGPWAFSEEEDGSITVSKYRGRDSEIEIPEGTNSIGWFCFKDCRKITSVVFPKSVSNISPFSFENCSSLQSIVIPDGVKTIRTGTFEGCTSLKTIHIPDSVEEIEDSAFERCSSLTSVNIPESVVSINGRVFMNCTSLVSITIPSHAILSGQGQFAGCTSLASVVIKEGVEFIASEMFEGCTALKEIKIPDSVKDIYLDAFRGCTNLVLPKGITEIGW